MGNLCDIFTQYFVRYNKKTQEDIDREEIDIFLGQMLGIPNKPHKKIERIPLMSIEDDLDFL